jgi:hypothetical protein
MDEQILNNESIYELLNLDTKYHYIFVPIVPIINGITYNTQSVIKIFKNKVITGDGFGMGEINLQLNTKESNVSNLKNKSIIFDSIKCKVRCCINIIENITIMKIITNFDKKTKYDDNSNYDESCFCELLCYSDISFRFNKNVILGDDTIKILKEKGFTVYYYIKRQLKSLLMQSYKETKQYVCFWENNIDNNIFICNTFKGLGILSKTNEKLVTNFYITNVDYTKC